jgi:hypothetical protein
MEWKGRLPDHLDIAEPAHLTLEEQPLTTTCVIPRTTYRLVRKEKTVAYYDEVV